MRVAVIMVWRPKHFPRWHGRSRLGGELVPKALAQDLSVAPYTGVHLASLFPAHWQVSLIHEMVRDVDLEMDVDAVFLSTLDFCAPHAAWLGRQFRARGLKVIVGGIYPTLNPDYFEGSADAVVVGEAEPVMPQLLADLEGGTLAPRYRAGKPANLAELPVPRFELVETDFTLPLSYEITRSCPFSCSFCVLSAIREPYRRRPIPHVLRDLKAVPSHWKWIQRKFVTFWDNNLGADRHYFRELCEALVPLKMLWATETSLDTINPESARMMGRAGCRVVYIGLESLTEESLHSVNKKHNRVQEMKQKLDLLHQNGVIVMSIFLLGLDGDTPEYLRRLPELVDEVGVDIPVYSLPVPIEKTPFKRQLQEQGRLIPGDHCDGMDGVHLLYKPRNVSPDELELALYDCQRRSYTPWRTLRRMARRLTGGPFCAATAIGANWFYMWHQREISRIGRQLLAERGPWREPEHPDTLLRARMEAETAASS